MIGPVRLALLSMVVAVGCVIGQTAPPGAPAPHTSTRLLHAVLKKSREGKAKSKFLDNTPKISAFWQGEALNAGDKIRIVWIAEGVGEHKEATISEASVTAYKPDDEGVFSLARPVGGWPVGDYRVELYVGNKLAQKLKFTIESGPVVELD